MITLEFIDPNFILSSSVNFSTASGSIIMSEGEPITIRKRNNGFVVGDGGNYALYLTSESAKRNLLSVCDPFNVKFTEGAEEDFEVDIVENCDVEYKLTKLKIDKSFQQELHVSDVNSLGAPLEN